MAMIKIPHFGPLDPQLLEEYYDTEIDFNGNQIQVDLNFGSSSIDPAKLETVKAFIDNIRIHDIRNKQFIDNDYKNEDGDTVKTYLEHHLEELGEDVLAELSEHEKQLLKKLRLVRVGIYTEGEDQFAIFDYSLGQDITDYLVVINTDENGNLVYMTMES
jgi:hypothetical protein